MCEYKLWKIPKSWGYPQIIQFRPRLSVETTMVTTPKSPRLSSCWPQNPCKRAPLKHRSTSCGFLPYPRQKEKMLQ